MPVKKMLIVDDIASNRLMLKALFEDEYETIEAENGRAALDIIKLHKGNLSVILLDIVMPEMDGFEVIRQMEKLCLNEQVPVVMITAERDDSSTILAYQLGVADHIYKPFNPEIAQRRVQNVVRLHAHSQFLEEKLAEQKHILELQSEQIQQSQLELIDSLSTVVEFRNLESGEHIRQIRCYVKILLEALSDAYPLTNKEIECIANASAMHDIGKIVIPDSILLKPGPLTKEEFEIMKSHTTSGCEILNQLSLSQGSDYQYYYDICRHHHERWDGNGYPDKLKGDDIPIWAQVVSLADVYDALTSKRVYKAAIDHDTAVKMIQNDECGVFNPKMMSEFLKMQHMFQTE